MLITCLSPDYANAQQIKFTSHAIAVETIDPAAENYDDLIPLMKKIGSATVVALGEGTHDNGAALLAKARMVKFLHEKMGFDVLLFEYAFLGSLKANKYLSLDSSIYSATRSLNGWLSKELYPGLYEYIRATHKTGRPLFVGGFDHEKVPRGVPDYLEMLEEVYQKIRFNEADKIYIDSLVRTNGALGNRYQESFTANGRRKAEQLIDSLRTAVMVSNKFTGEERDLKLMYLKHLLMMSEERSSGEFKNIVRDYHMAERYFWIHKNLFAGKKVILWAATAHLVHDMVLIDRDEKVNNEKFRPYYQMGDYLNARLGKNYYVIGFTSYAGERGQIFPRESPHNKASYNVQVTPAPHESFEAYMSRSKYRYAFVDLESVLPDVDARFTALPLGNRMDFAPWAKILDALFYVGPSQPVKH